MCQNGKPSWLPLLSETILTFLVPFTPLAQPCLADASMDSFDLVTGGEEAAAQVEERLRIQKRLQLPVIDPNSQPEDLRAMMSDPQDCIPSEANWEGEKPIAHAH